MSLRIKRDTVKALHLEEKCSNSICKNSSSNIFSLHHLLPTYTYATVVVVAAAVAVPDGCKLAMHRVRKPSNSYRHIWQLASSSDCLHVLVHSAAQVQSDLQAPTTTTTTVVKRVRVYYVSAALACEFLETRYVASRQEAR